SLHDALPIWRNGIRLAAQLVSRMVAPYADVVFPRSDLTRNELVLPGKPRGPLRLEALEPFGVRHRFTVFELEEGDIDRHFPVEHIERQEHEPPLAAAQREGVPIYSGFLGGAFIVPR